MGSPNTTLSLLLQAQTQGDASVERLANSLDRVVDISTRSGASGERAGKQLADGFGHAVPQVAAASGAIREFEGSLPIRAVERFLTTTLGLGPALQNAFPIVGGLAFAGMLVETGTKLAAFFREIESAPEHIRGAFGALDDRLKTTNDELILANDKVLAQIAILEHKPNNALKEGLDEARVAADKLSDSLTGSLSALNKMLSENTRGALNAFIHGNSATDDIRRELGGATGAGGFYAKVHGANGDAEALKGLYNAEIEKFQKLTSDSAKIVNSPGLASFMGENRLQILQGVVGNLKEELAGIQPSVDSAKLKAQKDKDDAAKASATKATELQRQVDEYAKSAREFELGPVSLAIQKRDEMLAKPGLTSGERVTINEAGALEIARALAKIADEQSRLRPLIFKADPENKILSAGGTGIDRENSLAARTILHDAVKMVDEARATIRTSDRESISSNSDIANRAIDRIKIGARPEDAIRIADETLSIRNQQIAADRAILEDDKAAYGSAQGQLELSRLKAELDQKSYDASEAHFRSMREMVQRQQDQVRNIAGSFLESAFGGSGGISNFLKSNAERFATGAFENLAGHYSAQIQNVIPKSKDGSFLGMLLKGLPGGPDPMKSATDLNTQATIQNTAALQAFVGSGGGSFGGGTSGPSGLAGLSGAISSLTDLPVSVHGSTSDGSRYGSIVGLPAGITDTGTIAKHLSTAAKFAAGAEIAGGGVAAYQGFSQGGTRGALEGSAGVLGMASGIMSLIPAVASSIPIIGTVVAAALPLISSFLGDPKQQRANAISKELTEAIYHAPTAINKTVSTDGTYMDRDSMGNYRTSPFSGNPQTTNPYTYWGPGNTPYQVPGSVTSPYGPTVIVQNTYHVNAMDAQSFHDFAQQNHEAIGAATATNLGSGHTALAQRLNYLR